METELNLSVITKNQGVFKGFGFLLTNQIPLLLDRKIRNIYYVIVDQSMSLIKIKY